MMVTPVTILTVSALQAHSTYILFPVYTRVEQALLHLYAENIPESAEFFKQDIADLNHSHVIITHAYSSDWTSARPFSGLAWLEALTSEHPAVTVLWECGFII